jgi:hypothetical protein
MAGRDPERIDRILSLLREVWMKVPDWRLGQIVHNAVEPKGRCPEIFYVEDDRMEQLLSGLESGLSEMIRRRKPTDS